MKDTLRAEIREAANDVVKRLGPMSGIERFGYSADSVAWIDAYVERERKDGLDEDKLARHVTAFGAYLGEAIVAATGGHWIVADDGRWGVRLPNGSRAFPFSKVRKQFTNGAADSIASYFDITVNYIGTGRIKL